MNKVELTGVIEPSGVKLSFENGRYAKAVFSIAVTHTYRNRNKVKLTETDIHSVEVYDAAAYKTAIFRAGDMVSITGKLKTRRIPGALFSFSTYVLAYRVSKAG